MGSLANLAKKLVKTVSNSFFSTDFRYTVITRKQYIQNRKTERFLDEIFSAKTTSMLEEWQHLEEFPGYAVSTHGNIANVKRDRLVVPFVNQRGIPAVALYRGGERLSRSVSLLVASTFIPEHPDHYNSPLHLNADKLNCRLDNLTWRPRGFTRKYYEQFEWDWFHEPTSELLNLNTGEHFETYTEPCVTYGIRAVEIIMSTTNDSLVFPTWHRYRRL